MANPTDLLDRRHNASGNCPHMTGPAQCTICQRLHQIQGALERGYCEIIKCYSCGAEMIGLPHNQETCVQCDAQRMEDSL